MWRLPEDVALALRRIIESGHDERLVMVAFLYHLAESVTGQDLERQVRRRILKAHLTGMPDQDVMDATVGVLEDWERKWAMIDT
jgi:hypothetical protein